MHLGIHVISPTGQLIQRIKTFTLRCHACTATTQDTTKKFCPKCGGPTLTRVTTVLTPNGPTLFFKKNYHMNLRGTKYTIPDMKGGKQKQHGNRKELILREDQKEFIRDMDQRKRLERKMIKEAQDGDVDGFATRRIDSWQGLGQVGFGRRNPNEGKRRVNKKKHKNT